MTPFYATATFWATVVSAVAAVIGGILTEAEVALFVSAAGIVIAYLIQRGIVEKAAIAALTTYNEGWEAGHQYGLRQAAHSAKVKAESAKADK
jgi:hypothetical protein